MTDCDEPDIFDLIEAEETETAIVASFGGYGQMVADLAEEKITQLGFASVAEFMADLDAYASGGPRKIDGGSQ